MSTNSNPNPTYATNPITTGPLAAPACGRWLGQWLSRWVGGTFSDTDFLAHTTININSNADSMRSNVLHRSETWPVRKENKVALQWAEMRMVRWMCGIKL